MTILQEIHKWSKTQPAWQQDAIARLYEQRKLDVPNIDAVHAHLKAAHGIPDPEAREVRSLGDDEVGAPPVANRLVQLVAIKNLLNVNALATDQRLPVEPAGLTIIYGENGAGKSGYSRVLKKACRARDQREVILPDASKVGKAGVASAQFEIMVDGAAVEVQWTAGVNSPEQLSELAIFDASCARAYLDNEGDFAYAPYGLDILEGLASLCRDTLRPRILAEMAAARPNIDALTALAQTNTKAGAIAKTLSSNTKPAAVESLATMTDAETERLAALDRALAEADPKRKAGDLRLRASTFTSLASRINAAYLPLGANKLEELEALVNKSNKAKEAAAAAAQVFQQTPGILGGTGGDAWKELFEKARAFAAESHAIASFPALAAGDPCPLCQNTLGDDGAARLALFDTYMKAEAAAIAKQARAAATDAFTNLKQAQPDLALDDALTAQLDAARPGLAARCLDAQSTAKARKASAVKACGDGAWAAMPALAADLSGEIAELVVALSAEAKALDDSTDEKARVKLVEERAELEARRRLGELKTLVLEAIKKFSLSQRLQNCLGALSTLVISRKSTELSNTMATKEVVDALNAELKALKVHELKALMKPETVAGRTQYKLILEHPGKHSPAAILSEGEQRAIAIASFLAEISLGKARGGVVFDDPVSSLDHRRRWEVARRLAKEAKTRQVIVFTHDIYFLCILQQEAAEAGIEPNSQCIHRTDKGFGVQTDMLPFDTLSTSKRVKALRALHLIASNHHKAGNEALARDASRNAYSHLRMAWERCVEEVLLQGVVTRFKEGISTQPLPGVTVEDDDIKAVEAGMTKSSKFSGHDPAAYAQIPTPDPSELLEDIEHLETWRKAVVLRADDTKKRRKAAA